MFKPLSLGNIDTGVCGCERVVPYNEEVGEDEYGDAGTDDPVESEDPPLITSQLLSLLLSHSNVRVDVDGSGGNMYGVWV